MSEYAFTGTLFSEEVTFEGCVVPTVGLWQVEQPVETNNPLPAEIVAELTLDPLSTTPPVGGGASNRMKSEKAETSSRMAAPADPGLFESSGYPAPPRFRQGEGKPVRAWSSPGRGRSCGNRRLLMPISTL